MFEYIDQHPGLKAIRDELVQEMDGGIKYNPIIQDILHVNKLKPQQLSPDLLSQLKNLARANAQASQTLLMKRLKDEIQNDPANVGYAGKSRQEIFNLLTQERTVTLPTGETANATRWNVIIVGIPYCRNILRPKELQDSAQAPAASSVVGG